MLQDKLRPRKCVQTIFSAFTLKRIAKSKSTVTPYQMLAGSKKAIFFILFFAPHGSRQSVDPRIYSFPFPRPFQYRKNANVIRFADTNAFLKFVHTLT